MEVTNYVLSESETGFDDDDERAGCDLRFFRQFFSSVFSLAQT